MHRAHRRQISSIPPTPTGSAFTGAATLQDADTSNTVSLLVNSAASGKTAAVQTAIISTPTSSSSSAAATPSSSQSSESSSSSDSISIGQVIGICLGVFAGLAILLLFFYYYISKHRTEKSRGTSKETERRKSGRELWVKMEDQDGDGSYEKYAIKRTTVSSATQSDGSAVGRSITVKSVKSAKSAKTFKSLGYGTNLGLAETFKTPDLPPHLEFTDTDMGTGRGFVGSGMPSAPFTRVENPPISWDGETVRDGESYLSLERGRGSIQIAKQPVSPNMVVSHQTPPAVETTLPQWERAEIVSPEGAENAYSGVAEPRHPYAASRSSEETIRRPAPAAQPQSQSVRQVQAGSANPFKDQNPFEDPGSTSRSAFTPATGETSESGSFYTVQSDLTPRTGAFAATATAMAHHEREDSNDRAMASLIAALNITQEEARQRLSAAVAPSSRESAASGYSLGLTSIDSKDSEALDEDSFNKFPLPPTDVKHHNVSP